MCYIYIYICVSIPLQWKQPRRNGNDNSRPRVAHIQTFSLLSNHANSSFQLDAFVEYWVVIEIGSLERSALPDKLSS